MSESKYLIVEKLPVCAHRKKLAKEAHIVLAEVEVHEHW